MYPIGFAIEDSTYSRDKMGIEHLTKLRTYLTRLASASGDISTMGDCSPKCITYLVMKVGFVIEERKKKVHCYKREVLTELSPNSESRS